MPTDAVTSISGLLSLAPSWMIAPLAILGVFAGLIVVSALFRRRRSPRGRLAPFQAKPLLNQVELRLASILDRYAKIRHVRLLTQVSYGEFLTSKDRNSFFRMNSRRADFVLVNYAYEVKAVIELHGSGHFGSTEESRARAQEADALKSQAVTSAGIPFVIVRESFNETEVRAALDAVLEPNTYRRSHGAI